MPHDFVRSILVQFEPEQMFGLPRLTRLEAPRAKLIGKSATTCVEVEAADTSECFCCEELDLVLNLVHSATPRIENKLSWTPASSSRISRSTTRTRSSTRCVSQNPRLQTPTRPRVVPTVVYVFLHVLLPAAGNACLGCFISACLQLSRAPGPPPVTTPLKTVLS